MTTEKSTQDIVIVLWRDTNCSSADRSVSLRLGERQMKIYPWGKLPACRFLNSRRLEAYAMVRNELPLALLATHCWEAE
jgi:hypothetical protein